MSSTDDDGLRRFFDERLVPAAQQIRARGIELFPLGPDDARSWYTDGPDWPELVAAGDGAEVAALLRGRWESQGLPELASLAEPLLDLAAALERPPDTQGELSAFLYVMY